jgi:antitoxin component YwqK of YwqJK toxin-antitoxin module
VVRSFFKNTSLIKYDSYRYGKKHGKYEEYAIDGQVVQRTQYENGHKIGLYEEWYPNGQLKRVVNYIWYAAEKRSVGHGYSYKFYENGRPWGKSYSHLGRASGIGWEWHEDGSIANVNTVFFFNPASARFNAYVSSYPTGIIKFVHCSRNVLKVTHSIGHTLNYSKQGRLTIYTNYHDRNLDMEWDDTGKIKNSTPANSKVVDSIYKIFENPVKINYAEDKISAYWDNGQPFLLIDIEDSVLNGKLLAYTIDGLPVVDATFKNNMMTSYKLWYANGKPAVEGHADGQKSVGKRLQYYDNGNVAELDSCGDNDRCMRKSYFLSGKLETEYTYIFNGGIEGVMRRYHENGNLYIEDIYTKGAKNGYSTIYHPNGVFHDITRDTKLLSQSILAILSL